MLRERLIGGFAKPRRRNSYIGSNPVHSVTRYSQKDEGIALRTLDVGVRLPLPSLERRKMEEDKKIIAIVNLVRCCSRIVLQAEDKNYDNNRCTVELDDVEEIEEWLNELFG